MEGKNNKTNPFARKMETALYLQPTRFKEFQCIGADCSDMCCKGNWKIFVDKESYYMLREHLNEEDTQKVRYIIKPRKDKRTASEYAYFEKFSKQEEEDDTRQIGQSYCGFLTQDNRCSLQQNYGEDSLCYTCYIYPRINYKKNGIVHRSLQLSCPEAVRILLDPEEKMEFEYIEHTARVIKEQTFEFKDEDTRSIHDEILRQSIDILQERSIETEKRLALLGLVFQEFESIRNADGHDNVQRLKDYALHLYRRACSQEAAQFLNGLPNTAKLLFSLVGEVVFEQRELVKSKDISKLFVLQDKMNYRLQDFEQSYLELVQPFFRQHFHMIEHYMVNLLFSKHRNSSLSTEYKEIALTYAVFKFFAVWYAMNYEKFEKEDFFLLVQQTDKFVVHTHNLIQVNTLLREKNWDDMLHLISLFYF